MQERQHKSLEKKSPLPCATALAKWVRNKDISASQTIAAKGK